MGRPESLKRGRAGWTLGVPVWAAASGASALPLLPSLVALAASSVWPLPPRGASEAWACRSAPGPPEPAPSALSLSCAALASLADWASLAFCVGSPGRAPAGSSVPAPAGMLAPGVCRPGMSGPGPSSISSPGHSWPARIGQRPLSKAACSCKARCKASRASAAGWGQGRRWTCGGAGSSGRSRGAPAQRWASAASTRWPSSQTKRRRSSRGRGQLAISAWMSSSAAAALLAASGPSKPAAASRGRRSAQRPSGAWSSAARAMCRRCRACGAVACRAS